MFVRRVWSGRLGWFVVGLLMCGRWVCTVEQVVIADVFAFILWYRCLVFLGGCILVVLVVDVVFLWFLVIC